MRKIVFNSIFMAVMLLMSFHNALAGDNEQALELVRSTADAVLEKISENKAALKADPKLADTLVSDLILPHFDFTKMTQSAMGRYWKRASESQQATIVSEFRMLLIRTYSVAVLNYSGQAIEYLPVSDSSAPGKLVTVQTIVTEADGGPRIPIDYRLANNDGNWKVFDVVIDGVSLVANYRTSFAGQIRRGGFDGLINQLRQNNSKS